ncbi:hypothetical protein K530_50205 [Streptomyces noursei CCRC 11814]|nr:non-ribosomal peptide synthetase [Streptomyces noursei]EPY93027.1 hypothetical protein K530_50205 [Streptomyces noursei CCRC 11814]
MDNKRALLVKLLRQVATARPGGDADEGIAVVGLAGRYPLADTPDALWANLRDGRHCITEVPPERWDAAEHYAPDGADALRAHTKWGGFLADVDKFDPLFFHISPTVAENMDPQERLFLQTAWETLEDAGYPPRTLGRDNPVGVFVGLMNSNYEWMGGEAAALGVPTDAHSDHWSLANRVSHVLDLTGPSMAIDTACSASLTAVHLACESLRRGECNAAIAGGVNLILHPKHLALYSRRNMVSHDDRCKSFGTGADGFVAGEGVGAVLLKPLRRAVADGDRIHGVIRGSAVNAGGKTVGYTVPSPTAQAEVIKAALRRAGVDPRDVSYVEAHGTGTPLGDPIEIAGLQEALAGNDPAAPGTVAVGSVKSNIGHLESAAGIAGLTKVLLQMRHGQLAPSLHSAEPNPEIDFAATPFTVQQELADWPRRTAPGADGRPVVLPRTAGVSSFGGGGANAHVVVEEYLPERERTGSTAGPQLLVVSARTPERLREQAGRLADFLADAPAPASPDPAAAPAAAEPAHLARCARLAAEVLGVQESELDADADLADFGFGPAEQAKLAQRLHEELGIEVPTAALAGATLHTLAASLDAPAPAADAPADATDAPADGRYLADVAHTLQVGREPMDARLAFVAHDLAQARALLRDFADGRTEQVAHAVLTGRDGLTAEARARLARALDDADLTTVADLWTRGAQVDWARLRTPGSALRTALPTYAFARKRYWIPEVRRRPAAAAAEPVAAPPREPASSGAAMAYYGPVWTADDRPSDPPAAPAATRVLILATEASHPLADALAARHPGAAVRTVRLDRAAAADWAADAAAADRVYHLAGVRSPGARAASLAEDQETGITTLFRLAGHLTRTSRARTLTVVTSDVHRLPTGSGGNPHAAALQGLTQVLPKEVPGLRAVCVDLDAAEAGDEPGRARLAAAVVAEPGDRAGDTVVLRRGVRYVRRLTELAPQRPQRPVFRDGGVYLVVGGTGGIGRALSEELARTHRARLVWLSRTAPDAAQRDVIERVRAAGGDVLHVAGDAAGEDGVRRAVEAARTHFGALHGVFHSAMVFNNSALAELTEDAFRAAVAVKMEGCAALAAALGDAPLDFLAFFSSMGAFAGSAGNGTYTTATAFEDAYALDLDQRLPYPVRVVNWGYWGEVGSGDRPGLRQMFAELGVEAFGPRDGLDAIPLVLAGRTAQVMPIRAHAGALAALGLATVPSADPGIDRVAAAHRRLDELSETALLGAFQRMGVFARSGEVQPVEGLAERLGVPAKFARQLRALLNMLVRAGHLVDEGDRVRALPAVDTAPVGADALRTAFDRLAVEHPDLAPVVTLTRMCLERYPEVLRGTLRATEIMFPDASMDLVKDFYKGNPLTDCFNDMVADAVRAHLAARPAGERIRVLELGAGTGATSERVLPVLAAHADRAEYWFTDISARFLEHGQEQLGRQHPYTVFRVLDLEKDVARQGFEPGTFDVVVATNVVHATRDLRTTLGKAKHLLKPGGRLVLNELTTLRSSNTVGGGVLEGWWLSQDAELRMTDAPLATPETWQRLLREAGFEAVTVRGGTASDGTDLGQSVVTGRSDGAVAGPAADTVPQPAARAAAGPAAGSQDAVLARLVAVARRALKIDEEISPDLPLQEYGFDSLTGMKIVSGIADEFGATVELNDFYEYPTLREAAAHFLASGVLTGPDPAPAPAPVPTAAPAAAPPVPAVPAGTAAPAAPARPAAYVLGAPEATPPTTRHPLSRGQYALWVVEQLADGAGAYNLPLASWLAPDVDVTALRTALQSLLDRHPQLRATVRTEDGEPFLSVDGWQELSFVQRYLTVTDDAVVLERLREEVRRPFDLARGPLLRATLHSLADGRRALLLVFHHLVFDGVSIGVFLRELEDAYRAAAQGRAPSATAPSATYADFTTRQHALLAGPEGERLRAYWTRRLHGELPVLQLPLDRPRPAVPSYRGASVEGRIDAALTDAAKRLARTQRVSLYVVLVAAYVALLHRHSAQRRILVGTPTTGRPADGFDDVLGYFMNMVVLDQEVAPDAAFTALLGQVSRTVSEALEHSAYPLIDVARALQEDGRGTAGPLFQAAFYFQNWLDRGRAQDGLVRGMVDGVHQEGEFDVTLEVIEERDGCRYTVKYNPDLFDEDTVQRLGAGFVRLLDALVAAPDRPVGTADLLAPEERRALHEEWNATRQDYPRDRLVCELVDEQAAARPDAVAVVCGAQRLTYRELADRVDRLAGHLRARGAAPGRTVGVLMERSADLLVALLAVLKAGGAYVPLDPSYPTARLAHMAADARLHLLVAHSSTEHLLAGAVPETVVLDRDHALIAASPGAGPVPGATAEDTAYVLYTSGSTGEPKGVEVGHRALVNFLVSMAREPGLGPDDRLLALTTVCFDIAGLELYGPLITGGRVEILPTEDARDGVRLRAALEAARPTVVQATPATWKMLLAAGWPGDPALKVLCGGEALDQDTADRLTAGCGQVWNLFGPTETTIWSAADRLLPGAPVTIGRPLANTQLYVLDEHRTPLPVGVPGELYIGGDGLARGYLGRPELTRERFVANPLADGPSPRLYRTGDLVRRLPDGRIGYLGRIDSQVKVRGFRVELTEIEATLRRLPGVREAVVVAREVTPGNVGLRAFYLGTDSTEGAAAVDKDALRAWLPEYMVPDVLVRLRSFPQTLNGKVDRTALAARELAALRAAHGAGDAEPAAPAAPQGRTGHQDRLHAELAAMVGELVNLPAEAVPSDAPLGELGMNSVTFTALSTALQRRFGIPANPTLFYQYPTLTTLVPHLHGAHPQRLAAAYGAPAPAALTGDRAAQLPAPAVAPAPADGPHPAGDADVAIIGMAGRFPSSVDLDAFWDHLVSGRDLIQEIPADRWDWRDYAEDAPADPDAPRAGRAGGGTSRSRWGGFLPDVDRFDAAFFGISPREAELMDPQQRLVLEAVWTAVEDAGYRPGDLAGRRVGVFLGVTNSDYPEVQRAAGRGIEGHTVTGSALSVIPNRVSYLLDLRGPSVAMDTACSSSLTAVEQAVTALHEGSCDLALAGGVNLILSPALYVALSRGEMLSEDGRCKAFDSRANGYVRGEGVGVVLLKPRVAAERDDDPVHAVIKAVEVGHGGRTNSLTSPNPNAQADLVLAAHRRAGTDPATVGYLEAHGTGTALGDPIEIAGLKDAFVALHRDAGTPVPDRPTCLVGSVKTNIGHLEGAAGIAGLIKTVLAMRHAEIPATLHYERRNPYVDFTGTPFEVVDRTRPWPAPQGPDGRALPRRAGVSSFGFGGATAHVVLEEAVRPRRDAAAPHGTLVFPLSARTAEALAETADRLARFLHAGAVALPDVAHTLQVGREAFEERLAIVTDDRAALLAALAAAARDTAHPAAVRGRVPAGRPAAATDGAPLGLAPVELARRWAVGADVDWRAHAPGGAPAARRIALPTYPFARTRHWVAPGPAAPERPAAPTAAPALHRDLLDRNVSTFRGTAFDKTLTGTEFFLRDHVVAGTPVLPGVAYLDMARLAGELAHGAPADGPRATRIEDVVWAAPVTLDDGPRRVRLRLTPGEDAATARFELVGVDERGERAVHGSGRLHFTAPAVDPAAGSTADPAADPEVGPAERRLDPSAVRARCTTVRTHEECYAVFTRHDFAYGPCLALLDEVAHGTDEALAVLSLPAALRDTAADYRFHPAVFDAALQAVGVFAADSADRPHLPYAIRAVELLGDATRARYAHVTRAGRGAVFDIRLADADGLVVARIDGFTLRPVPGAGPADGPGTGRPDTVGTGSYVPEWTPLPAAAPAAPRGTVLVLDASGTSGTDGADLAAAVEAGTGGAHAVLLPLRSAPDAARALERAATAAAGPDPVRVVHLAPRTGDAERALDVGFGAALEFCRGWTARRLGPLRYLYAHRTDSPHAALDEAMGGFARSVRLEQPHLHLTTLACADDRDPHTALLAELAADDGPVEVLADATGRRTRTWRAVTPPHSALPDAPFGTGGVHLVTGGTGHLGVLVAERIAARTAGTVVLVSRSEPGPDAAAAMARAAADGGRIVHLRADVSRRAEVDAVVRETRRRFGALTGVVHAAGVLRDGFVLRTTRADADAVLGPKVLGALWLDEATRDEPLAYFCAFSSLAAVLGGVGQSSYAYANAFLGAFLTARDAARHGGLRAGRSLAVDWPLWRDGGMTADAAAVAALREGLGMVPLQSTAALDAWERALAAGAPRVLVAQGDQDAVARALPGGDPGAAPAAPAGAAVPAATAAPAGTSAVVPEPAAGSGGRPSAAGPDLGPRTEEYLVGLLAEELRMPADQVDVDESFERYGIDSLLVMSLTRRLEEHFGPLSKTLFFEYLTVRELAGYFTAKHPEALAAALGTDAPGDADAAGSTAPAAAAGTATAATDAPGGAPAEGAAAPADPTDDDAIAIIGVAGRYPQADTLDAFWRNLREGTDCIEEVPADRWDHSRYYDPDPQTPGRTAAKWGGFLSDPFAFDPMFFRMSKTEADHLDPQERLFLQTVWHLLEDAGYTRQKANRGRTGLFVGMMYGHYQLYGVDEALRGTGAATSSSYASVANRASYFFGFTGPSVAVDTMCSSSLVTLHLAGQALRDGDCEVAVAGGVNVTSHPVKYLQLSQRGFLSSDGRCRSFGEGGDGYVPGEGTGAVLLKKLSAAERDGDRILAVLRGSAVNHGGASKGYSVPSPRAQGELIAAATARSGLDPRAITYVEAHGTGTALGDPIEISGLMRAYEDQDLTGRRIAIGSVKSNIGHAESAAGIAAVTKVLLQLRHRQLVPSLHAERLNPHIDLAATPFEVQRTTAPWPAAVDAAGRTLPRAAAVSAFGAGGTNAHLILEEYVPHARPRSGHVPQLFVLSARDEERLAEYAGRFAEFLGGEGAETDPEALVWTLQTGREAMPHRLAVTFADRDELVARLIAHRNGRTDVAGVRTGTAVRSGAAAVRARSLIHI